MSQWPRWVLCVAVTAGLLVAAAGPAAAQPAAGSGAQPVYLALGDSVAAGFGATSRASGYVGQLTGVLRENTACAPGLQHSSGAGRAAARCAQLQLVDLAEGGSTTHSMIAGDPGLEPQLAPATSLLRQRNGNSNPRDDVRFVTVTIGGNDVFGPVVKACIPEPEGDVDPDESEPGLQCAQTITDTLTVFQANLAIILGGLRAAAGPDTTIVATAYANPLIGQGCRLAPFALLGDVVLQGGSVPGGAGATLPAGLNTITHAVADRYHVLVADAFGRLGSADFTGDCLHPDQSGYDIYTGIFADTILDSST